MVLLDDNSRVARLTFTCGHMYNYKQLGTRCDQLIYDFENKIGQNYIRSTFSSFSKDTEKEPAYS